MLRDTEDSWILDAYTSLDSPFSLRSCAFNPVTDPILEELALFEARRAKGAFGDTEKAFVDARQARTNENRSILNGD
jgi:hypothetical protein